MENNNIRPALSFGLFITVGIIGVALAFHYYLGFKACSLCMVETALFIMLSGVLLVALMHNPKAWSRRVYGLLLSLISFSGVIVAGRHSWFEKTLKDQTPQCKPLLETWMNDFSVTETIHRLLNVYDGCSEISFTILSLTIPELISIIFLVFLTYSLRLLLLAR